MFYKDDRVIYLFKAMSEDVYYVVGSPGRVVEPADGNKIVQVLWDDGECGLAFVKEYNLARYKEVKW